MNDLN